MNRRLFQLIIFGLVSLTIVVFLGQQVSAEDNVNLTAGQWMYRAKYFIVDGNGCGRSSDREEESTVTIIQRGGFRSSLDYSSTLEIPAVTTPQKTYCFLA